LTQSQVQWSNYFGAVKWRTLFFMLEK